MKKIIILSVIMILSVSFFAFSIKEKDKSNQKAEYVIKNSHGETWMDVLDKINGIVGDKRVIVTEELKDLFIQYNTLYDEELKNYESKHGPATMMLPTKFCWVCYCQCCGCTTTQGECKSLWGACPMWCPCNNHGGGCLYLSVMSCQGSPCGPQQGAN
jgi:hypothetical protein